VLAHVLVGEPDSISPEHALGIGSAAVESGREALESNIGRPPAR
jgi:hypothetical protein